MRNISLLLSPLSLLFATFDSAVPVPAPTGVGTAVVPCYNILNGQCLLTWVDQHSYSACLALYDADGLLLESNIALLDPAPHSPLLTTFNPHANHYFLTYVNSDERPTFLILNSEGAILHGPTVVPGSAAVISGGFVYHCYNSTDFEYLLVWKKHDTTDDFSLVTEEGSATTAQFFTNGATGNPTCVYNPQTNEYLVPLNVANRVHATLYNSAFVHLDTVILPASASPLSTVSGCYNPTENQYLLAWLDSHGSPSPLGYAICAADGSLVVGPSSWDALANSDSEDLSLAYNTLSNQFLIPYQRDGQGYALLTNASGGILSGPADIPLLSSHWILNNHALFATYSSLSNTFCTAYDAYNDQYSPGETFTAAVYAMDTPIPSSVSSFTGQRYFRRIGSFGEYYNQLNWNLSNVPNIAGYRLYRNGVQIQTLPPTVQAYQDHNQPNHAATYSLYAVDIYGQESIVSTTTF